MLHHVTTLEVRCNRTLMFHLFQFITHGGNDQMLMKYSTEIVKRNDPCHIAVYLIEQNFGGQNCRKSDLIPKIIVRRKFCPPKIVFSLEKRAS